MKFISNGIKQNKQILCSADFPMFCLKFQMPFFTETRKHDPQKYIIASIYLSVVFLKLSRPLWAWKKLEKCKASAWRKISKYLFFQMYLCKFFCEVKMNIRADNFSK